MVDSFITALYCLAEHCQYGTLHDEMIRDRIVVRLKNMKLSEKLQNDPDLTLQKAIQQACQSEAVKQQQSLIRSDLRGNDSAKTVDAVHCRGRKTSSRSKFNPNSSGKPKPQLQERRPPASQFSTHDKCQRCGKIPHHNRQNCPAQDAVCRKCKKKGHYEVVCRSAKVIGAVQEEDFLFLGGISSSEKENPWVTTVKLNQSEIQFKIDTGADVTIIPESTYKTLKIKPDIKESKEILYGPGHNRLQVLGQFKGYLQKGGKTTQEEIFVIPGARQPLLGHPAIATLELVSKVEAVQAENTEEKCRAKFPKLFEGLGE